MSDTTRTLTIVTRPDGITQEDVDANLENIKANATRVVRERADAAGLTLEQYVRLVLVPDLLRTHTLADLQGVYALFGISEDEH